MIYLKRFGRAIIPYVDACSEPLKRCRRFGVSSVFWSVAVLYARIWPVSNCPKRAILYNVYNQALWFSIYCWVASSFTACPAGSSIFVTILIIPIKFNYCSSDFGAILWTQVAITILFPQFMNWLRIDSEMKFFVHLYKSYEFVTYWSRLSSGIFPTFTVLSLKLCSIIMHFIVYLYMPSRNNALGLPFDRRCPPYRTRRCPDNAGTSRSTVKTVPT